ncbi:MAG: Ig-like domain-containing protein [Chloroflexi bacterium]|nr:Ig-like domain-containing protein [Chloroflexota bacterium]
MKSIHTALLCLTLIVVACSSPTSTPKSTGEHEVAEPFRGYYNANGGALVLGVPITSGLIEEGVRVQYFQNVRLEYHPQLPEGKQVIPSSIGINFEGNSTPCIRPQDVAPNAYYFDCHSVRQEFLGFFNQQGGLQFFGYPISEMYISGTQVIQHFERASIVWNKSKPVEYQFGLLNLGSQWCTINKKCQSSGPANVVTATPTFMLPPPDASPKGLGLKTLPEFPVFDIKTQRQTLKAWVTDDKGKPVSGIVVSFSVQYAVSSERYETSPSDRNGYAFVSLAVKPYKPGDLILYRASITQNGVTVSEHGSFVVWGKP